MKAVSVVNGPFYVSFDDGATVLRATALEARLWNGMALPLFTAGELIDLARVSTGEMRGEDVCDVVGRDEAGRDVYAVELWGDGNGERESLTLAPVAVLDALNPWDDERPLYSIGDGYNCTVCDESGEYVSASEAIYDALMREGRRADADAFADENGAI